jgi:hypothetical protein
MSVKIIMEGRGFAGPVCDKEIATLVSQTAATVDSRFGTDFKDKTGQTARSQSSQLHSDAIVWTKHSSYSWSDSVRALLQTAGSQIQSGDHAGAALTFSKIKRILG